MSVQTTLDDVRAPAAPAPAAPLPEVLLIDLSSLFWSAWHSSGEDEISAARRRTLEGVLRCIGDQRDRLVAICCDSGRSFRKDMFPEYKANRPEKDHASVAELETVKEKLRAEGFLLWEARGFEADDVIATATAAACERGHAVTVASADKDLLQLCWAPGNVRALRTHNWSLVDEAAVVQKFGVGPDRLGDWLALVGDASDNIKGAPGIGPKTATNLLTAWKSIDGIFEALGRGAPVGTPSVMRSLQQNADDIRLARKLIALRTDAPIEFARIYEKPGPKPSATEGVDMDTPDPTFVDLVENPQPAQQPPGAEALSAEGRKALEETGKMPATNATEPAPPTNGNGSNGNGHMGESTALVRTNVPFELALEPTSLGVAFKLANALYASRLYTRFPTPEAIAAVMIRGREMGIGALTALDCFHVIDGKPCPIAHFLIARAMADPDCEYFQLVHSDYSYAEYITKHRKNPKPTSIRYTIEQAIDAGLCGREVPPKPKDGKDDRNQWDKRRAELLRKTCGVQLGRIVYPGALLGLYAAEEMGMDVG